MPAFNRASLIDLLRKGGVFWAKFAHATKRADEREIRAIMASADRQDTECNDLRVAFIYLQAMLGDATGQELVTRWHSAITGLDGIQAYQFASRKQKAMKLAQLSRDPQIVAAWQAAAVGAEWLPLDVLSLLLVDASEASVDALLPHVARAGTDPDRLALFEQAARFETPPTSLLFARVRDQLSTQRSSSAVLALGEQFGLATRERFRLTVELRAAKPAKRTRGEQTYDVATVTFDSNETPGFTLSRGQQTTSRTSSSSWSRAVSCSLESLPKALARAAKQAHVTWDFGSVTSRPIGPKRAAALLRWLEGARPSR